MWNRLKAELSQLTLNKTTLLRNLALPLSIILPVTILYLFYPSSFEITFGTGRAPYLIFLWILCLELAINWRQLSSVKHENFTRPRIVALASLMIVPTAYALAIYYTELNKAIIELGRFLGVPDSGIFGSAFVELHWPVAFELALFALCFFLTAWILYKRSGLSKLVVAFFFIWAVAAFNITDTFFPVGKVWALQILVPITVNSAASVLRLMGYSARTMELTNPLYGFGTAFTVFDDKSIYSALVFWPSAGVHSMIIYALTILLFIRSASMSITRKAVIFVFGALGTFLANVLRIVAISKIGLDNGALAAQHFHDYYGEFFFISWMLIFLAIVALGPRLLQRLTKRVSPSQKEPDNYRA